MAKFKTISITLLLAVILLVAEIIIVRKATDYEPQIEMVFADCKIPEGTAITDQMLTKKSVAASSRHKYSILKTELAVGKIANTDIEQGEMVLSTKLADVKKQDIEILLGDDGRLIAVELDAEQANAWRLESGSYVDLLYIPTKLLSPTLINSESSTKFDPAINYRFENIRIAALVDTKGRLIKGGDDEQAYDTQELPRYILFEVPLGTDEEIALAEVAGKLEVLARLQ